MKTSPRDAKKKAFIGGHSRKNISLSNNNDS